MTTNMKTVIVLILHAEHTHTHTHTSGTFMHTEVTIVCSCQKVILSSCHVACSQVGTPKGFVDKSTK